jgi:hypothetical protein
MNLADVMQEMADRLEAEITDFRKVFGFPPDRVGGTPTAIVTYPDDYAYDATYGRGSDRIQNLPVVVLVGKVDDRGTRELIGKFADGSGDASVKQALESGEYTAFDTIRVQTADFDIVTVSGTEYLAATFACDITGKGTA